METRSISARDDAGRSPAAAADPDAASGSVPAYLRETYAWAYIWPTSVKLLDRPIVVSAILWGNYRRLLRAVLAELRPGQRVYQPACVYGNFSRDVADALGARGRLEVTDILPVQVANCRRKLRTVRNAVVRLQDAAERPSGSYDAVCCFFLLHEIPTAYKHRTVNALLEAVEPGGKVIFVDYHRPHPAHPLKGVTRLVFDLLEPFAKELWSNEIAGYASRAEEFVWSKRTYFGDLFQKVVAERK